MKTVTGNSLTGFLQDATRGFPLWLNDPSNNAYISISRIDLRVLYPRFFAHSPLVANLFSDLLVLVLVGLVSWYFYKNKSRNAWQKSIYLSEMLLISCLSIAINYSQPTSSVMLAPAVVFLLNDLCFQIKHCAFSRQRMSVWLLGVGCLLVQTAVISIPLASELLISLFSSFASFAPSRLNHSDATGNDMIHRWLLVCKDSGEK